MERLDINSLYRAGALAEGANTTVQWPGTDKGGGLAAGRTELFWTGSFRQKLPWEWEPFLNGRFVRPKWRCVCGVGARFLWLKGERFTCRTCAGVPYPSRVRRRSLGRRIARLSGKVDAPRSKPSHYRARVALREAEGEAYAALNRLLAELERKEGEK